jgi:para-aminobenzoate synthetase component 1
MIAGVTALRPPSARPYCARFSGLVATELQECTDDPAALDTGGRWVVVATYEGRITAARFRDWSPAPATAIAGPWRGPTVESWRSSLDQLAYEAAVESVKDRIGRGDIYQANVCRILTAELPDADEGDLGGLHALLASRNPAPFEGFLRLPGLQVATASPELFLQRRDQRVRTGPIKGTGRSSTDLLAKDEAENVMIVDLMRNDLSRICRAGSVRVPRLLVQEQHPGLVHLVSEVTGTLRSEVRWPEILQAVLPPGSVSGAPKTSAVQILRSVEPVPRGPYCGALGWVDADTGAAELAVGIRTFWSGEDGVLRFGTGAGITWGSHPAREWRETQLKGAHLLSVAAGAFPG